MRELPIEDFGLVHKGQLLAQLVDDDYRAAAAHAEAGVASAAAQAQALKAQHALQPDNVENRMTATSPGSAACSRPDPLPLRRAKS